MIEKYLKGGTTNKGREELIMNAKILN